MTSPASKNVDYKRASKVLLSFIRHLDGFTIVARGGVTYSHVGAALSDAILQSGINYKTVVWPRVQRILDLYPEQCTTPAFRQLVRREGAKRILQWRDTVKPTRLVDLIDYCFEQSLVTCADIASHLSDDINRFKLLRIRGVGPKTVDYLAGLVGVDTVAVDRHVLRFIALAGICSTDYSFVRDTVARTADALGVTSRSLDHSIWLFETSAASKLNSFTEAGCEYILRQGSKHGR